LAGVGGRVLQGVDALPDGGGAFKPWRKQGNLLQQQQQQQQQEQEQEQEKQPQPRAHPTSIASPPQLLMVLPSRDRRWLRQMNRPCAVGQQGGEGGLEAWGVDGMRLMSA